MAVERIDVLAPAFTIEGRLSHRFEPRKGVLRLLFTQPLRRNIPFPPGRPLTHEPKLFTQPLGRPFGGSGWQREALVLGSIQKALHVLGKAFVAEVALDCIGIKVRLAGGEVYYGP